MIDFFLRLFKADTLRRLHIYLSDILKYAAKNGILNQGVFLKASYIRDKTFPFSLSRSMPAMEQGLLHGTESGPPPSVLEAVGQLSRLGLATPRGPLSGTCLPPRPPGSA